MQKMYRIIVMTLTLLPTVAHAANFVCDMVQYPVLLELEIDRQTGYCMIGGIEMTFQSSDEDFVCLIPELAQTFRLAPGNSWAIFDDNSDVVYSGRCTPL